MRAILGTITAAGVLALPTATSPDHRQLVKLQKQVACQAKALDSLDQRVRNLELGKTVETVPSDPSKGLPTVIDPAQC